MLPWKTKKEKNVTVELLSSITVIKDYAILVVLYCLKPFSIRIHSNLSCLITGLTEKGTNWNVKIIRPLFLEMFYCFFLTCKLQ